MIAYSWLILTSGGLVSGILAGLLGIGGGFIIVFLLVTLGYTPLQALATSSLVILVNSISGTFNNWCSGYLDFKRVIYLALPALVTAQIGVYFAMRIPSYILLLLFGVFLLTNIYLIELPLRLVAQKRDYKVQKFNPVFLRIGTGGTAGFLAGLLGIGGGMIMVPLQILFLGEGIKVAIQTSLGVVISAAASTCVIHALAGNVLFFPGLILALGGLVGAYIGTRFLPKLADQLVSVLFRSFLGIISLYMFWQAWRTYQDL